MSVQIHFDRPASFLLRNLHQEIGGWIAAPRHLQNHELQVLIDGSPITVHYYRREDVEQHLPGRHVIGWTLWLDPGRTFHHPKRTLEFTARLGDQWTYTRHFFKTRSLMSAGKDGALYFMHIPKTAGTALRSYVDFAFSEFPSLLVYGDHPGVDAVHVSAEYRQFAATRDLFFGHFDFDLTRRLHDEHPKVVTVFRPPHELVRSYLNFASDHAAEFLDNPLVRHICGLSYTKPAGLIAGKHLDKALQLIDRHFLIVQQNQLQSFADEVSSAFGLQHFTIPRINVGRADAPAAAAKVPFNTTFDEKLYSACLQPRRSFLEFLDT
jgi:hypothetical protein